MLKGFVSEMNFFIQEEAVEWQNNQILRANFKYYIASYPSHPF